MSDADAGEGADQRRTFRDHCLAAAERYAKGFTHGDLPSAPAQRAAVVTCMDARMETGRLLGLAEGDVHVIRNAGGVVTDDVLRSLTISQRLLGTREIVVIQHTGCGMTTFRDDDLKDEIEAETGLRPPFAMEAFVGLEANVRQSLRRLQACPYLPIRNHTHGFIYDVKTGRLREVT